MSDFDARTTELLNAWMYGEASDEQLQALRQLLDSDSEQARLAAQFITDCGMIDGYSRADGDSDFSKQTSAAANIPAKDSKFLRATMSKAMESSSPRFTPNGSRESHSRRSKRTGKTETGIHWLPITGAAAAVLFLIVALQGRTPAVPERVEKKEPAAPPHNHYDIALEAARERVANAEAEEQRQQQQMEKVARQRIELTQKNNSNPKPAAADPDEKERQEMFERLAVARRAAEADLEKALARRQAALDEITSKANSADAAKTPETPSTPPKTIAQPSMEIGRVVFVESARSPMLVRGSGQGLSKTPLQRGMVLKSGDRVETAAGNDTRPQAALGLFIGGEIDLSAGTDVSFKDSKTVSLERGLLYANIEHDTSSARPANAPRLTIETQNANVLITGTRFDLFVDRYSTRVRMEAGSVKFHNKSGNQTVGALQSSTARAGQAPSQPAALRVEEIWRGRSVMPQTGALVATINFGPGDTVLPAGVLNDSGKAFDAKRGYGWMHVLPDDKGRTRARPPLPATNDPMLLTQVWGGSAEESERWVYTLPNGKYLISLCVGDALVPQGPNYVKLEGLVAINNVMTDAGRFHEVKDFPVEVKDGELTMDVGGSGATERPRDGSSDTTLNYIIIKRAP